MDIVFAWSMSEVTWLTAALTLAFTVISLNLEEDAAIMIPRIIMTIINSINENPFLN